MPIRQNILRKGKAPKQNLLGFDVLQEETGVLGDLSTSKFFKISEFPSVLPTGNSSFLIEGSDLLKPNVELKTEILDSQGNPIFHYGIPNYDKELPARRMTIEVYEDDVINGIGSFTILAELDPRKVQIPTAFQDTYNVRFSAPISINKQIKNTRPIRFYGDPKLTVSELVKGVIQGVYTGNQRTKTITGSVSLNVPTPQLSEYGADDSTTADSTRINEVGNSQAAYISQNVGEVQSSILGNSTIKSKPYATYVVGAMEKGVDNDDDKITSTMKGATFSITSPEGLVDSSVYPDAEWTKPTTFSTKILDVINSTTFTTTTQYKIKSKKSNQELVVPLEASASNSTITHNVGSVVRTASQIFQRSFANVTVGNLRTFSGDTYKAKIYMKEDGSSGEFEKIYETLVESPNELIDQNSDTGFKSVGIFPTQSIIDNFWVSSSATFTATQDDDTIVDGVILSGSTEPHANSFTFETSQSYSLEKNEPYLVDFDVAFKPTNKVQSDGTEKKDAKLEVFVTGTFLSETEEEFLLGEVELDEYDFNKINTFTKVKKKQVSDFLTHNIEGGVATGSLGFRVSSGEFILSDVRLRPFSETNFSPGFFKANVPMPKAIKRGQPYDFVVEFYDANNSLAEAVAVADDVTFQGPRQVLGDGTDGVLTGSVFLSNTEDTGIEFHGGSAYIRSVGYGGFDKALDSGGSGFMMYSGSVSKSLNTSESYQGVGLELMDNSGANPSSSRFLKFRTNAEGEQSEFEVRTDNFLFGIQGITNNYISGSNGNLEISSSNFQLKEDGDVTIEGTITAAVGGTIGGFDITTGSLAGADGHFFISGSASGSVGNFDRSNLFISSSGFIINSQGDVIARSFQTLIAPENADFSNMKFYSDHNAQSASILLVTGSLIVSSSQASSSLESVKLTTGSLVISRDAVNTETASLQATTTAIGVATASLNTATSSLFTSTTALGVATASLSGSVIAINTETGSLQASTTAIGVATASLNTTSASLLAASESMQTQLVLTSTGIDLKNTSGGFHSSFGLSTKMFGSASNALQTASANTSYSEISPDGMIIVKGSATASLFGPTAKIFDVADNNTYIEVGGKSIDIISGSVTGSSFGAATSSFFGTGSDNNDRIEVVGDGIQVYKNNIQVASIGDDVVIGQVAADQSNVQITAGALNFRNNTTTLFSISDGGDLTFDSSDVRTLLSGSVNAVSASLAGSASLAILTGSILTLSGSEIALTGSNLQTQTTALGVATGSLFTSTTALGVATASLSGAVEATNTVTGSLLAASESMQTQLVLTSTGMDLKNETGGVLSSFGLSTKLFGSASNATDYAEINPDGLIMVANSETASIFNAGGTTIQGGTATASLNAGGLALISAGVTGSLFSATGAEIYGAADKNERITISPVGVSLIANNVTGSFIDANGMEIYGASDKNERVMVNSTGVTIMANAETASIFNAGGTTIMGGTATASLNAGGLTLISGGVTASVFAAASTTIFGASANDKLVVNNAGVNITENNQLRAKFGAISVIGSAGAAITDTSTDDCIRIANGTVSIFQDNNNKAVVNASGLTITQGGADVAVFAGNSTITGGTITLRNSTNNNDKVILSQDKLQVFDNNTDVASFGAITRIGAIANNHISMSSDGLSIKTAANVTVLSASADGITMSGSINAGAGEIGGWTISEERLNKLSGSNSDVNAGIILDSTNNRIVVSGSTAVSDNNSIVLKGNEGVIEVKQDNVTIFNSGETTTFNRSTIVEPAIFKPSLPIQDIISSSIEVVRPVPTMDNQKVTSASQMNRLETKQFFQDTTAAGTTLQDALTPFFYMDRGTRMNPTSPNGAAPHQNPTASFVVATTHDMTGLEFTGSLFPPNFVFSSEYVTKPIETPGTFGFVSASASGSNIFTIMGKISGSTHDDEDGDTDDFFDAKFNLLGLEANTRGLPTARQNEYTFFQAKHSGSIRAQLQHDGDFISAGNITAFGTSFLAVSDKRLKDDIQTISESLDRILELRPTGFKWKESSKRDVGFIAQEVESIIPEIVETSRGFINTDNDQETKTIAYSKLTTYLVGAIQELTKRVEELEEEDK